VLLSMQLNLYFFGAVCFVWLCTFCRVGCVLYMVDGSVCCCLPDKCLNIAGS
jgi:hypothetical protein